MPRTTNAVSRYWITDPIGHRLYAEMKAHKDDIEMEKTLGFEVVRSHPPPDLWLCDLGNEEILIMFGGEPWPVPMIGSYALCNDHLMEVMDWPHEDERGNEIVGTRLGPWPLHVCACPPCVSKAVDWLGNLWSDAARS